MVNNSINISKVNNHPSSKIIKTKKTIDIPMENQLMAWNSHNNMAGSNLWMGSQPLCW